MSRLKTFSFYLFLFFLIAVIPLIKFSTIQIIYWTILLVILFILGINWFVFKGVPYSLFSATHYGFIFFYCLTPILFPKRIESILNESNLLSIFFIVLFSIAVFSIGYYFFPVIRWVSFEKRINVPLNPEKVLFLAFIIGFCCLSILFFESKSAGLNFFDGISISRYSFEEINNLRLDVESPVRYLSIFNGFVVVTVTPIIIASAYLNPKRKFLIFLLLSLALLLGWAIYKSGVRSRLAVYCLSGLLTYFFIFRPSKKKILFFLALAGFSILFLSQLQYFDRKGLNNPSEFSFDFGLDEYTDQNIGLSTILDGINNNSIHYLYGESYALVAVQFIPRIIFPAKPGGVEMYAKLANINYFENWNVSYGIIGEMAANFGLLFIPLGMFLYGGLLKNFWQLFLRNMNSHFLAMACSITFGYSFFTVRGNFNAMFSPILYSCAFLYLFTCIAATRNNDLLS